MFINREQGLRRPVHAALLCQGGEGGHPVLRRDRVHLVRCSALYPGGFPEAGGTGEEHIRMPSLPSL